MLAKNYIDFFRVYDDKVIDNLKVCTKPKNSNICVWNNENSSLCGTCSKKICKNDIYVTCKNCTVDYHIACVKHDELDGIINSKNWFCNLCFVKICNEEMPNIETFIDLQCKTTERVKNCSYKHSRTYS